MKAMKFTPVLLVVFFILVTFTIPVPVLSADCPCFTANDVLRYASHPLRFTCFLDNNDDDLLLRILRRGEYTAAFSVSAEIYVGRTDSHCSANVYVGDYSDPDVVLFETYEADITIDESLACDELLNLGDPQDCTCELVEELCD